MTPYIIRTLPKRWHGLIYHEAMVVPKPGTGELYVMDITQHSIRPRVLTLVEYTAQGDDVLSTRPVNIDIDQTWRTFQELETTRRYHVTRYNCDHFLDELQYYRPRSEQLRQKVTLSILFIFVVLFLVLLVSKKAV